MLKKLAVWFLNIENKYDIFNCADFALPATNASIFLLS